MNKNKKYRKKVKIIKLFSMIIIDNHRNIFMVLDNHRSIFMVLDNHR